MVVAQMDTKETYYWGTLADGMEIEEPQPVPSNRHPRDMFGLARNPATEGVVYLGRHCNFSGLCLIAIICDKLPGVLLLT